MGVKEWIVFWMVGFAIGGNTPSWCALHPTNGKSSSSSHEYYYCGFTRYPSICVKALKSELGSSHSGGRHQYPAGPPPPPHVQDILSAMVNKTISETKLIPISNFTQLLMTYHYSIASDQAPQHALTSTGYCLKLMKMSLHRLQQALIVLQETPITRHKDDIQTWLSAALTFQQACKDQLSSDTNDEHRDLSSIGLTIKVQILQKMDYLSKLASNTLALVNQITNSTSAIVVQKNTSISSHTGHHSHIYYEEEEEKEGPNDVFPRWVSTRDRKVLESNNNVRANAIVAKDGSGNFRSITEAIQAASGSRFVIYVKSGIYKEKIQTHKRGITLIGDGKYSTLIVGDDSVAEGATLSGSATFTVTGDGFIARDIGFQNTAGPQGKQAVALNIASDRSVLYKCSIAGYQDTLYALSLRQFYRECDIYGTIDFIFGNAAAVFQNCNLLLRRPQSGGYNVILANGRTDPGQNTGFSIQRCRITVTSEFASLKRSVPSYLGRPWKQYSRSVVIQSTIDDAIAPTGWIEWPGASTSSLRTLYFAEYANVGSGAATTKRVQWSGFHVIARDEAVKFTVANFIAGTSWLPSTGVTFISGL